jgi:hypothetical protein
LSQIPSRIAPRSRRSLLAAAAAAGGALATQALVRPSPVAAADVVLGAVNTATNATTIRNTQALSSAKAIVGLVTTTIAGSSTAGVQGQSNATNGNGLFGVAMSGPSAKGAWGRSAGISGRADPPDSIRSFVESPDMMNIYNGNVVTGANGRAAIRLPRYFPALNRDFRYQLTVIGAMAQAVVEGEIENGRFTIRTSQPRVKVSWQVTGIRKDPYANRNRIKVEESKPRSERGTYLHPKAYGKPVSAGVQGKKLAGLRRRGRRIRRDQELKRPA